MYPGKQKAVSRTVSHDVIVTWRASHFISFLKKLDRLGGLPKRHWSNTAPPDLRHGPSPAVAPNVYCIGNTSFLIFMTAPSLVEVYFLISLCFPACILSLKPWMELETYSQSSQTCRRRNRFPIVLQRSRLRKLTAALRARGTTASAASVDLVIKRWKCV